MLLAKKMKPFDLGLKQQKNQTVTNRTILCVFILRGFRGQQLLSGWIWGQALRVCHCSICQCGRRWWGVADRAFSSTMTDGSPGEVRRELKRSVFQWWSPPHTGRGCFPPHGSGGSEERSDLEATWAASLNVHSKQRSLKWKQWVTRTDRRWTRGSARGSGSASPLRSHVRLSCKRAWLWWRHPAAGWSGLWSEWDMSWRFDSTTSSVLLSTGKEKIQDKRQKDYIKLQINW